MKTLVLFSLVALNFALIGCGGGSSDGPPPAGIVVDAKPQSSFPELKKQLQAIATSGQKGDAVQSIEQQIDQGVRSSDTALADDLMKDMAILAKSTSSTEIKDAARRMSEKL